MALPEFPLTTIILTLLVMAFTGFVFVQLADAARSPGMSEFVEDSETWCSERGGELYLSNAMWGHGGFHCDIPGNTSHIHMRDVITPEGPA